jgi:hypothetical protein
LHVLACRLGHVRHCRFSAANVVAARQA